MFTLVRHVSVLGILCCMLSPLRAEDPLSRQAIAKRAKEATVLVDNKPTYGTGFCVHDSGLFVTNEHVVRHGTDNVKLVLHAGMKGQKVLKARVLRRDSKLDLAILKAQTDEKLSPLELGSDKELGELAELIVCSFPFGTILAGEAEYPAISVNAGSVNSLRHDKGGALHRIQLDAAVNPGSSGGPVLDHGGKVVGIVVSGIRGSGVNMAVPVSHLERFLARPEIVLTLPTLNTSNRHEMLEFTAQTLSIQPSPQPYDLELILHPGSRKERRIPMVHKDDIYRAKAKVFPQQKGPVLCRIEVQLEEGSLKGLVEDQVFRIGTREVKLSQVRSLRLWPTGEAKLRQGEQLEGKLANLDAVTVKVGKQSVRLDLADALELKVEAPEEATEVPYLVVARRKDHEVARASGSIGIEGIARKQPRKTIDIPDSPVSGTIFGANFTPEKILLQNTGLSLQSGRDNMHIFLTNLKPGKDVYEYSDDKPSTPNRPAIHIFIGSTTPPRAQAFTKGYTLRVEFGKEKDNKIPAKLYLSLGDDEHSVISGSFSIDAN